MFQKMLDGGADGTGYKVMRSDMTCPIMGGLLGESLRGPGYHTFALEIDAIVFMAEIKKWNGAIDYMVIPVRYECVREIGNDGGVVIVSGGCYAR